MRKRIINWLFKGQFKEIQKEVESLEKKQETLEKEISRLESQYRAVLRTIDVGVDVHEYRSSRSWAVISIQGRKADFIKFVDLGQSEVHHIQKFLQQFEGRVTVDATPQASRFLKINNRKY